jgi:carbon storage regulator
MLILGRRQGDQIRIGDDITIKVLDITRRSVRIGIEAPLEIPVYREEVYQKRLAEGEATPND